MALADEVVAQIISRKPFAVLGYSASVESGILLSVIANRVL